MIQEEYHKKSVKSIMNFLILSRGRRVFFSLRSAFLKKKSRLQAEEIQTVVNCLEMLRNALQVKDVGGVAQYTEVAIGLLKGSLSRSASEKTWGFLVSVTVALFIAFVFRQMVFELYEIPTGSMRPTFKEGDRVIASKTSYGINVPFMPKHFWFNPDSVHRGDIVVFTTQGMDMKDSDMVYFYLFKGKKQLVKRVLGKPGDILYFYGGKIYGINRLGQDISHELQKDWLEHVNHIPFIRFDGNLFFTDKNVGNNGVEYWTSIIYQMNQPVARLSVERNGMLTGEMLPLEDIHDSMSPSVQEYFRLWGIEGFATALLVQDAPKEMQKSSKKEEVVCYLELLHHPSFSSLFQAQAVQGVSPSFRLSRTYVPLTKDDLQILFQGLYTSRFKVHSGFALRYGAPSSVQGYFTPKLLQVPDGMYEFFNGCGYEIGWGSFARLLPQDHPLCQFSVENTTTLFNFGVTFDMHGIMGHRTRHRSHRFAYFRDGNFYVGETLLLKRGEPRLKVYLGDGARQGGKVDTFSDLGPPFMEDGKTLDLERVRTCGLQVPEGHYLALGDNFSLSSDSRDFGFVPEENLRGSPIFIFWPFGSRWGVPIQDFSYINPLTKAVYAILFLTFFGYGVFCRRQKKIAFSRSFEEE